MGIKHNGFLNWMDHALAKLGSDENAMFDIMDQTTRSVEWDGSLPCLFIDNKNKNTTKESINKENKHHLKS